MPVLKLFVLLIVLVFEQRGSQDDKASLERLCPVLKETVKQMNFRSLANQINCELVKSDPKEALRSWLEVLGVVIKAGGLVIDTNPPGSDVGANIFERIKILEGENLKLREANAVLEQELEKLRLEYKELEKLLEDIVRGGEFDLKKALEKIRFDKATGGVQQLLADNEKKYPAPNLAKR